jgi:hypothetical protein
MTTGFGTRGLRATDDVEAAFLLRRAERDASRRKALIPEALRGTLLDPHGERNSAEDAKVEAARLAAAARRLGVLGWALSCLGALSVTGGAIYGVLTAARMGLLPEWGILDLSAVIPGGVGVLGRSTAYAYAAVLLAMQIYLVRQFARRMFSAGPGPMAGVGLYLGGWAMAGMAYAALGFEVGITALLLSAVGLFVYGLIPGANR